MVGTASKPICLCFPLIVLQDAYWVFPGGHRFLHFPFAAATHAGSHLSFQHTFVLFLLHSQFYIGPEHHESYR